MASSDSLVFANFLKRFSSHVLQLDKAKCQLIKNGLMSLTVDLFEYLDAQRKGFITVEDLWRFTKELHQSYTKAQISVIFDTMDEHRQGKITYKHFLDALEPKYLLSDELALQLANSYDNPSSSVKFTAGTKLDFCQFLKVVIEQASEIAMLKDKLSTTRLSSLDYYRLLDPNCTCMVDAHDFAVFLEPFGSLRTLS